MIVEGVGKQFGGDDKKLADFVTKTRDFGKGLMTASTFWDYLVMVFGEERALVFLPKLARLVPDGDNRRALLRAPKMAAIMRHNADLQVETFDTGTNSTRPVFVLGGPGDLRPPPLPSSSPRLGVSSDEFGPDSVSSAAAPASPQELSPDVTHVRIS